MIERGNICKVPIAFEVQQVISLGYDILHYMYVFIKGNHNIKYKGEDLTCA